MVVGPHATNAQLDNVPYIEEPTSGEGLYFICGYFVSKIHTPL